VIELGSSVARVGQTGRSPRIFQELIFLRHYSNLEMKKNYKKATGKIAVKFILLALDV
jgi:hypothetical protein